MQLETCLSIGASGDPGLPELAAYACRAAEFELRADAATNRDGEVAGGTLKLRKRPDRSSSRLFGLASTDTKIPAVDVFVVNVGPESGPTLMQAMRFTQVTVRRATLDLTPAGDEQECLEMSYDGTEPGPISLPDPVLALFG